MLDNAADQMASYWKNTTFDGHAVIPITVPSNDGETTYNIHEDVHRFAYASRRAFEDDTTLQNLEKLFQILSMSSEE